MSYLTQELAEYLRAELSVSDIYADILPDAESAAIISLSEDTAFQSEVTQYVLTVTVRGEIKNIGDVYTKASLIRSALSKKKDSGLSLDSYNVCVIRAGSILRQPSAIDYFIEYVFPVTMKVKERETSP